MASECLRFGHLGETEHLKMGMLLNPSSYVRPFERPKLKISEFGVREGLLMEGVNREMET